MKLSKRFSSLVLALVLLVSLPVTTFAHGPEKKEIHYVALGDSLASGMTPYGLDDVGYPDYLANRFEQSQYTVDFTNFGIPGYTSAHLTADVLSNKAVQAEIINADFITISIGANDVLSKLHDQSQIPSALTSVAVNLQTILQTIDQLNSDVNVYVMGYYNPFPYLPQDQQVPLLELLDHLNETIAASTNIHGDTYVPTAKIIAKHYETYLPNPANIHLSKEGYQIVAKEFWKNIDKSKN